MEAATARRASGRMPAWVAGLAPLLVLGVAIAAFIALDAPGLQRNGVPVEELAVEKTELRPGQIKLTVRNDGPDAVGIRQAVVNDGFAAFTQTSENVGRLGASTVTIAYPWIEGQAYEVALVTTTGGTVIAPIEVAAETPDAGVGFFGLLALIGLYVGVIPVAIGTLWLPWLRSVDKRLVQFLMALTIGLLGFLGLDALLEGQEFAGKARRPSAAGRSCSSAPRCPTWGSWAWTLACAGARHGRRTKAQVHGASPSSCRSGSACTTWGRGWRSARPTPSGRWPWAPR